MTNEEAINIMQVIVHMLEPQYDTDRIEDAVEMAINALEQQPSDIVSRGAFEQVMWERDVAIGQLKELGYGLGQKVEPCDAISRQEVLDQTYLWSKDEFLRDTNPFYYLRKRINSLPSVTPQQKYGKWKVVSDGYGDNAYICECSECKDTVWVYKDADRKWNYCPSCGAKMVEPQESEKE